MKYIITHLFLCIGFTLMAQNHPNINVKTDTTNIKIGEQLTYTIIAPNGKEVVFPKIENLEGLEVAEELAVDTIKNQLLKKYLITGFDEGEYFIKQQEVFVDAKSYFTDSLLVNVATVQIDTVQIGQSINTKEILEDDVSFLEWLYMYRMSFYAILGLILIHFLLYYFFYKVPENKRKAKMIPKVPPYETATKELESLEEKELWKNNKIKEYYSELTDIVRKYIGGELSILALETTTDEMMDLLRAENKTQDLKLDKEVLARLQALLSQADFVKFAKQKPLESDMNGHKSDAIMVIETIHNIIESKKIEEKDEVQ